jgi:phosphoribosylanthranilate isomerase
MIAIFIGRQLVGLITVCKPFELANFTPVSARPHVKTCGKPVGLAGGLRPDDPARARAQVRPSGFDRGSGVRPNDVLDEVKLAAFSGAMHSR